MTLQPSILASDFHQRYIDLAINNPVNDAIRNNTRAIQQLLSHVPAAKIEYAYAEGKWTIKQTLQHIADAERVFSFRALWIARKDPSPLPGFDENLWAANADVSGKTWEGLIEEFNTLRKATEILFASFGEDELNSTGIASNRPINVRAIGYICAGHVAHHINILQERYGV